MAYMSEEGYQKLVAELKHLESVERPKIVAAIAEARDIQHQQSCISQAQAKNIRIEER